MSLLRLGVYLQRQAGPLPQPAWPGPACWPPISALGSGVVPCDWPEQTPAGSSTAHPLPPLLVVRETRKTELHYRRRE